ncbi:MAG: PCRF domain-containing protein, partial [Spongiibacteraceae bacterium]|nr:PCRF domain-containing protein [Spongiibacteraceae bacterium]
MELGESSVWDNPDRAQALGRERAALEAVVEVIDTLDAGLKDMGELLEMALEEDDADTVAGIESDLDTLDAQLSALEFRRMFSGEMDPNNAYLDIQAGSG